MSVPRLAVYLSGHGYGHTTRTSAFLRRLISLIDCELDVCSAGGPETWPAEVRSKVVSWRIAGCDVGVIQSEELAVDRAATEAALARWERAYPKRREEEVARLRNGFRAVFGDVPALAFDAAADAGVPSFALANFSWDWIYERLGFGEAAAAAARSYERAGTLLQLTPAAPMLAFRSRLELGVLGRTRIGERTRVRAVLGVGPAEPLVLAGFRSSASYTLPQRSGEERYVTCDGRSYPSRPDVVDATGFSFLELLAAADLLVAKAGYGVIADAWATGTPLLYTTRTGFPEDDVLDAWLAEQRWAAHVSRERLAEGGWAEDARMLLGRRRPTPPADDRITPGLEAVRNALAG